MTVKISEINEQQQQQANRSVSNVSLGHLNDKKNQNTQDV